jgi:hypothetical protein
VSHDCTGVGLFCQARNPKWISGVSGGIELQLSHRSSVSLVWGERPMALCRSLHLDKVLAEVNVNIGSVDKIGRRSDCAEGRLEIREHLLRRQR